MYVILCDWIDYWNGHCIVVYETSGQFVTSFGMCSKEMEDVSIAQCVSLLVLMVSYKYVCDYDKDRNWIF